MSGAIQHRVSTRRNSLSMRIVLATLFYSLLIALVVTSILIAYTYRQNLSLAQERFVEIETGYLTNLARGLWEVNNANVEALLDSIAQIHHVGKVVLTDETGFQFIKNEHNKNAFAQKEFTLHYSENNSNFTVGKLHIELSSEAIQAQLFEQAIRTAIITLMSLLIGSLCVLILFQRLVSRHLHTMAEFARNFDVNSLDKPLRLERPINTEMDELDVVEQAINAMQARLKSELDLRGAAEQELRAHKENLEAVIQSRTKELSEAKELADAANAAKSSFLANMSHEIRTPMNAVLGMLLLVQKTELNERQQDYVVKAHTAAKSLLGLLNDILDFSKIDAGKLQLENHPFEMDALMRELAVILSGNQAGKQVAIVFDIDASLPKVFVSDRLRLQQILINLAGNALKFTEKGSVQIRVSVLARAATTATLRIEINDTGIGISPEQQARIFEGFVQAEASTTRRFGGTGLGLAISKHLVGLLGGTLQLESQLGRGSRFWFDITLAIGELAQPQLENSRELALTGLRLLVVEDNDMNREIAYELLTGFGAEVILAAGGIEGVEKVVNAMVPFDVVIMDVQMPDIDGLEAARRIRANKQFANLPILAMTANASEEDRAECLSAGMNDHIGKPIDINEMLEHILALSGK